MPRQNNFGAGHEENIILSDHRSTVVLLSLIAAGLGNRV
jgi:hypothetical protein